MTGASTQLRPNLVDYEKVYNEFKWGNVARYLPEVEYFKDGTINVGYNCADKHVTKAGEKKALIWISKDGNVKEITFRQLMNFSNQAGNMLKDLGVRKGDRVLLYCGKIPETYYSILAANKIGAILTTVFTAFGPAALQERISDLSPSIIITDSSVLGNIRQVKLPKGAKLLVLRANESLRENESSFGDNIQSYSDKLEPVHMQREDVLHVFYSSGTTGKPKGFIHVQDWAVKEALFSKWALDIHPDDDLFWCTADPGWMVGINQVVYGPWIIGATNVVHEGRFDANTWYSIIERFKVTILNSAPTSIRMLIAAGREALLRHDISSLRLAFTGGEHLEPSCVKWGETNFGFPVRDCWGSSETGYALANFVCNPVRTGSCGKPLPGITLSIVDEEGRPLPEGQQGRMAFRPDFPTMRGIWGNPELYQSFIKNNLQVIPDQAVVKDGYTFFIGRVDDVIKTSGMRVGPAEIESVLLEHPAVAEAVAIGVPDPSRIRGEIVKAFIVLKPRYDKSEELKNELIQFVSKRLAGHMRPRLIEFRDSLPHTRSGKIPRRILRAQEMGLPVGDISGLED